MLLVPGPPCPSRFLLLQGVVCCYLVCPTLVPPVCLCCQHVVVIVAIETLKNGAVVGCCCLVCPTLVHSACLCYHVHLLELQALQRWILLCCSHLLPQTLEVALLPVSCPTHQRQ